MIKMMLVYICLITVSLVMVLIRRKKNKDFLCEAARHYVIFYYLVCLVRTMVGNGGNFLSTSFADKEIAAYIKVVVLCLCIAGGLYLVERIFKNRLQSPVNYTVGSFAALYIIYSCLIDFPKMGIVVILGAIGIVAGGALFIVEKYMAAGKSQFFAGNKKENYLIELMKTSGVMLMEWHSLECIELDVHQVAKNMIYMIQIIQEQQQLRCLQMVHI